MIVIFLIENNFSKLLPLIFHSRLIVQDFVRLHISIIYRNKINVADIYKIQIDKYRYFDIFHR